MAQLLLSMRYIHATVLVIGMHQRNSFSFLKSKPKYFIRYQERFDAGLEPHRFDKDIIRTWIREQCDPYSAMELPKVTDELIETTSKR